MSKTLHLTAFAALLALSGCIAVPATVYTSAPQPATYATFCSAGAYQCPVPYGTVAGTECVCPGLGAPSYGAAR